MAQHHWGWLYNYFLTQAGRPPSDFDMYVLWNTRVAYYEKRGFDPKRIEPGVRDHAQRFVNLVNRPL